MNEKRYSLLLAFNVTLLVSFLYIVFAVSEALIFLLVLAIINYFIAYKCHRIYKPVKNFKEYPTKGMLIANYIFLFIIIFSLIVTLIFRNQISRNFPDPAVFVVILNLILAGIFLLTMVVTTVTVDYFQFRNIKEVSIIDMIFQSIFSNLAILGAAIGAYFVIGAGVGIASF